MGWRPLERVGSPRVWRGSALRVFDQRGGDDLPVAVEGCAAGLCRCVGPVSPAPVNCARLACPCLASSGPSRLGVAAAAWVMPCRDGSGRRWGASGGRGVGLRLGRRQPLSYTTPKSAAILLPKFLAFRCIFVHSLAVRCRPIKSPPNQYSCGFAGV